MEQELAIIKPEDALALGRPPDLVLEEATKAARALKDVIESKPKKLVFNGQTYLQFEDWQTLGRFYGVTALGTSTKYVEFGEGDKKVCGFEARADALLVTTNQVISSADAMCLNDESKWSARPKYEWHADVRVKVGEEPVPMFQLRSMAQTRACAKALRNVLAWVVVLAGYSPTPAEEMTGDEGDHHPAGAPAPGKPLPPLQHTVEKKVTKPQIARMFAIAHEKNVPQKDVEVYAKTTHGISAWSQLDRRQYDEVVDWIQRQTA